MATRVGIIVLSGTLDKVIPAFMLANTSAAMGMEVGMFFSFAGINVLHKEKNKQLKPSENMNLETDKPLPSLEDLLNQAKELGVKLYPCNTAMQMFGIKKEDLIEGTENPVGASTFLGFVNEGDKIITLNF